MQKIQIVPSILAGDFGKLADEAIKIEQAGADGIHIDIMDGHFVPNLTLGPKAVQAIRRATPMFLDVHIMAYRPFDYIERFVESGANRITFHFEATEDVEDTLAYIRKCRVLAGLAFCPETSESLIVKYLNQCDLILLMTVNPGFGGQAFMEEVLDKVQFTRKICDQLGIDRDIQVDGGIDATTGKKCVEAGANVLVSGTYLFKARNMKEAIQGMR